MDKDREEGNWQTQFVNMFSSLLDKQIEVEMMYQQVDACYTLQETASFLKQVNYLTFPEATESFGCSGFSPTFGSVNSKKLFLAILMDSDILFFSF